MTKRVEEMIRFSIMIRNPTNWDLRLLYVIHDPEKFAVKWMNLYGGTFRNALGIYPVIKREAISKRLINP